MAVAGAACSATALYVTPALSQEDPRLSEEAVCFTNGEKRWRWRRCPAASGGAKNPAILGVEVAVVKQFKVIVEKHADGYVAYPIGLKGVVVGEGDSYEEALMDVKSAIAFHIETFGDDVLGDEAPVLEAFIAEAGVAV